jgi:GNAT superfamily N-acetyltransferase
MTITDSIAATEYPLDLAALKKAAARGDRECRLIRNGGPGIAMDAVSSADRASSPMPSIGLVLDPDQPVDEAAMAGLHDQGVKLILWKSATTHTDAQKQSLWISSRVGIWNHLIFYPKIEKIDPGLLAFALNNPNIVNSYGWDDRSIAPPPAALNHLVKSLPGYSRVAPLPGTPIWKAMDTPEQLLSFLNAFGLMQMGKWMVMGSDDRVHSRGGSVRYYYAPPASLPAGYVEEICRMVESGGSVNMQKVRYNLAHAFLIGYAMEFGVIVGNSSLKQPGPEYLQSLKRSTGIDFSGFLERGYTSVRPEYRGMGLGTTLLEGLTQRTQGRKLYSIIAEDNLATQKIALRNRTRKLTTFFSEKTGKQVGVWVYEHRHHHRQR